jgi:hypothetical protein
MTAGTAASPPHPPAAGNPPSPLLRGAVWLGLLAAAAGCGVGVVGNGQMGLEALMAVALGLLILAPIFVRLIRGEFDLFEPMVMVSAVYFLYFSAAPLIRFAMDDMVFVGRNFQDDYAEGLLTMFPCVLALWAGYALPVGPSPRQGPGPAWSPARARTLAWACAGCALLCMVLWARVAGRSVGIFFLPGLIGSASADSAGGTDVAYFFLAIEWFIPVLLILMAMGGLRGRGRLLGMLLFITIIYISIGFRYRIVVMWLAVGMLAYLRTGTRPNVLRILPLGVAGLAFIGWLGQARLFFRSAGTIGKLGFDFRGTLLSAITDTRIFETFMAVQDVVPQFVDHAGIQPFVYPLVLPIPRFLWPGKPFPNWLLEIGGSIGTREGLTLGAAVPHFGEYYIAFGWPGMIIGMFVFGMGVKALWRWYKAAPDDPWRQVVFALHNAFLFQVIIRGYLAQIVQEWAFYMVPVLVIMWMSRRAARRGKGAAVA